MLVLEIEMLMGRYVAKQYDDHARAEWPPHPAKVFSALAAAYFEDRSAAGTHTEERSALEWLGSQPAPSLYASNAEHRTVHDVYVPTNDKSVDPSVSRIVNELIHAERNGNPRTAATKRAQLDRLSRKASEAMANPTKEVRERALCVLPTAGERKRPRTFPSVHTYDPIVQLIWPDEPEQSLREALDVLAGRVIRLGHPSSLVRLAWGQTQREPTWIPDQRGSHTLRWVSGQQLSELEAAYEVHQGTRPRVLPFVPARYRHVRDPAPTPATPGSSVFGNDWVVFELLGKERLPIVLAVDVAMALRGAALAQAGTAPPEVLSGHEPSRAPSQRPHVAYVGLPFAGFPHADGSILGVAAVLPRGLVGPERTTVLHALGSIQRLTVSPGMVFGVRRIAEPRPHLRTLDPLLWCGEGIVWGTVTPILLDRFPGELTSRNAAAAQKAENEAKDAIAGACERIGLPRPRVVSLAAPCFQGSPAADQFRRRDRRGLVPRVRVHALIDFGTPVRGPVLLGAGRYVGLGLCRPLEEERTS